MHKVVTFDGTADGDWVISIEDLEKLGDAYLAEHPGVIEATAKGIRGDQLATLIYTSGTTGRPKGVRLRHSSWVYEGEAIRAQDILSEDDLEFRWLPMAHSFGKVLMSTQMAMRFLGRHRRPRRQDHRQPGRREADVHGCGAAHLREGPRPDHDDAGGRGRRSRRRSSTRPSRSASRSSSSSARASPSRCRCPCSTRSSTSWSSRRSATASAAGCASSSPARPPSTATSPSGSTRPASSSSRATASPSRRPARSSTCPSDYRFGTVGPVFPASEVKLGEGDEVMIKGPGVMDGYHNLPEETAKTLTDDGWLKTGDKGALDADGYLRITGRIKELFKTSGGKYIAPPAIEAKFKAICPYASQFMVFGNERNYVVALITLDPDALPGWAAENGVSGDYAAIVKSDACHAMVAGLRRRAQQEPQPLGDHQEVGAARPRPHRRVRRAHPVDEGQAQRRRGQLQGRHLRLLRLIALRCARACPALCGIASFTPPLGRALAPSLQARWHAPDETSDRWLTGFAQETHRVAGSTRGMSEHHGPHDELEDHDLGLSHDLPKIVERQRLARRGMLAIFGGVGVAALAGCAADSSSSTPPTPTARPAAPRTAARPTAAAVAWAATRRSRSPRARSPRRPPAPTPATAPTAPTCSPSRASYAPTSPAASATPAAWPRASR